MNVITATARKRIHRSHLEALPFRAAWIVPYLMFATDVLALECSLLLGFGLRRVLDSWFVGQIELDQLMQLSIGIVLLPVANAYLGLYPGYGLHPVERMRRRTYTTLAVFLSLIAWDKLVLNGSWSRGVLLATLLFALTVPSLFQAVVRYILIRRNCWGVPAFILGAGEMGKAVARVLQREPELGLVGVGMFDDDPAQWDEAIHDIPVLGPLAKASELSDLAKVAVIAIPSLSEERLSQILRIMPFSRCIVIPKLVGMETHWVTARDLGGFLGLEIQNHLCSRWNKALKRALDCVISIPLCLISLPIVAVFAAWIRMVSPGPAFYSQEREGKGGRKIHVFKLRTMHVNAEEYLKHYLEQNPQARLEWERFFKLKNDPRVIPAVGQLLRRTSLDELPQFWSILKGDMSLVGPRPFPHYHIAKFPEEFQEFRRNVLPGLTGLWQVFERSNGDLSVQEKLDTYYIRNWSLWLDLYLLIRTFRAVVAGKGAY